MKIKFVFALSLTLFLAVFQLCAQMRIHLIDVGQGSATLVEFPCAAILIDGGGEEDSLFSASVALKTYLDDFFDRRTDLNHTLQCVYLTHPHLDHALGVPIILNPPYLIKNIVTDGLEHGTGEAGQISLHRLAQARDDTPDSADDIGFEAVHNDEIGDTGLTNAVVDAIDCGEVDPVITVLWGTSVTNPGWKSAEFKNENNHSLAIKIETGGASMLITGDLEDTALDNFVKKYTGTELLDVDVYVVGHHGSKNGTTEALLDMVSPKFALIGMGDPKRKVPWTAWAYGHPNKGILEMLEQKLTETRYAKTVQAGTSAKTFVDFKITKAIYATGWDGNVVLEANAAGDWHPVKGTVYPEVVDLNTASLFDLEILPGLDITRAQSIISFRARHGKFTHISELHKVPGIGPATFNLIRPYVTIKN